MGGPQAWRAARLARLAAVPRAATPTARPARPRTIVTSLFDWLRDVGYLQLNPAAGLPKVGRREPEKQARFLSPDDTALLREAIAARPGEESGREARLANARDLFAVDLFERTGLRTRVVHAAWATCASNRCRRRCGVSFRTAPPFQWLLRVERGKGGKARWVPCDEIALSLQAYRIAFGLPPVPLPDENLPLLLSVRRSRWGELKGIRSRTAIWKLVTGLCSEALASPRPRPARRCRPA